MLLLLLRLLLVLLILTVCTHQLASKVTARGRKRWICIGNSLVILTDEVKARFGFAVHPAERFSFCGRVGLVCFFAVGQLLCSSALGGGLILGDEGAFQRG